MDNQEIALFVLAIRSHRHNSGASVRYFGGEEEAQKALDSIDAAARCQIDIKLGKAVFNIMTDDIDFWRDSKEDSWFRAKLQNVSWLKIQATI